MSLIGRQHRPIRLSPTCAESAPQGNRINGLAEKSSLHLASGGPDQALAASTGSSRSARRMRFGRTMPRRSRRAAWAASGWVTQRSRI
jgi:hypothetical protein